MTVRKTPTPPTVPKTTSARANARATGSARSTRRPARDVRPAAQGDTAPALTSKAIAAHVEHKATTGAQQELVSAGIAHC